MTRIYFLQAPYVLCYFPVNLKDKKERTALTFAAELGHPEVTSWLLKAEADVRVLGLQLLEAVSCPAVHPFVCVVVCSMRALVCFHCRRKIPCALLFGYWLYFVDVVCLHFHFWICLFSGGGLSYHIILELLPRAPCQRPVRYQQYTFPLPDSER